MKIKNAKKIVGLMVGILIGINTYACSITPTFNYTIERSCGLPYIVKIFNTSSGNFNNSTKFWLKVNGQSMDTILGLDSVTVLLKKSGNNSLKLFVKDSSGCIDSSSNTTINVTTTAKTILDQSFNRSHSPEWINCLMYQNDPDTFRIKFESADTLKRLKIIWGDGQVDTTGTDLAPNTIKQHLYNSLGSFEVKIITLNASNCYDTIYGKVTNQRIPTAGIIGPPSGNNRGCVPHRLRIINNSYNISNLTKFQIEWGDGESQFLPYNASNDTIYHTYTKGMCAGIIKLTASNVCGSSFTTWNPVDISDKDKALWTVQKTCVPSDNHIFYNNSSDKYCLLPDVKEYFWDFGDGTTFGWTYSKAEQYHKYAKEGDYVITLLARNGCGVDTFKDVIRVFYKPVAGFSYDENRGCNPLTVNLTDTSKGRGYKRFWTITEGNSVYKFSDSILSYTFTKPGTHTVSIKVVNQCDSSIVTKSFVVNDKPTAKFSNLNNGCIPHQVNFNNTSTSYFTNPTFEWHLGNNQTSNLKSPSSKTFTTPGLYEIILIVKDSCGVDTFTQVLEVFGLPVASFNGDTVGCTFDSLKFVNNSTNSTQYNWSMGDNNNYTTSNLNDLKHAYHQTGNYTVRLISGTSSGCKDTAFHQLVIKPGAKAMFDINKSYACAPASFTITDKSLLANQYKWYANNVLVSESNTFNEYSITNDSTIVKIKLLVTSSSSCQNDSIEKTIFTPKNPQALINNNDSGCGILNVLFSNQSTSLFSSQWDLGNSTISNLKNPTTQYLAAKYGDTIYKVKLLVRNWLGCKDSTTSQVKVFVAPTSVFVKDKTSGCGPLQVSFTNQSKTNNSRDTSSLSHQWYVNNNIQTAKNIQSSFNASLSKDTLHKVVLITTSMNGCRDTTEESVTVYPKPKVDFMLNKDKACYSLDVITSNMSAPKGSGSINNMTFEWNFGNGMSSNQINAQASFKSSLFQDTNYTIRLIGYSQHGCIDSAKKQVVVYAKPTAVISLDRNAGCAPLKVRTLNNSRANGNGALMHQWNFNNGFISSAENDSAIYHNNLDNNVNYDIDYVVTTVNGCKDTSKLSLTVYPKPKVDFVISTTKVCSPAVIIANDQSINPGSYRWGLSSVLNQGNASASFALPGLNLYDTIYRIYHQVASPFGCLSDIISKEVLLMGKPVSKFIFNKDSICSIEKVSMLNNSLGAASYLWSFGDGKTSTAVNPSVKYVINPVVTKDTTFDVRLISTSVNGCKDTTFKTTFLISKPLDKMTMDKSFGCTDLNVSFTNNSNDFKTLYWDFGDKSATEVGQSANHTFVNQTESLVLQPKITLVRSMFNCRDTITSTVLVYPKPVADFSSVRPDVCDDGLFQFVDKSKNSYKNTWTVNSTDVYEQKNINYKFNYSLVQDTLYNIKLVISNIYNCKDSALKTITLKPKMVLGFQKNPITSCENGKIDFTNLSKNAVRYFWRFGDGGISNEVNPSYIYDRYGYFKIMLYGYNDDGCVDSTDGTEFMRVYEKPIADFTYGPIVPKLPNAIVDFVAKPIVYGTNLDELRYEWDFGDNSGESSNNFKKTPTHKYEIAGNVNVTLIVSNDNCSDMIQKPIFIDDPKPVVDFTASVIEGCAPLKVDFNSQSVHGVSYRWIFGDGTPDSEEENPTHYFRNEGVYDVTLVVTGTGGVTSKTQYKLVNVYAKPLADFYASKTDLTIPNAVFKMINLTDNVVSNKWAVFDSIGNVIQTSNFRDPSFFVNQVGRFDVRLIAENSMGCVDTAYKSTYLRTEQPGFVYTPSAFTPNNNGMNEVFKPSLFNVKQRNYVFAVYNRWGEKVFETTDLEGEWDGVFKGVQCPQETYVWSISGEFENNELFSQRGTVTLLR
ncbi:MAG: PKD domain-containing protein [Bacteroidota bacterium]|nr:PKD domain-containing protein [Bacteroidota bacterium]